MVSWVNISQAAANGQLVPLTDLLNEYGQDILADISDEDWACCMADGEIYGVRNNKELACGYGVAMATSVLDELGYDVSTIKTEADLTELLRLVKENYPDMYPIVSDNGTMGNNYLNAVDWLGTENDFGVLENALDSDTTTVVDWWSSDTYKEICNVRHQWVEEGLMMPDPTINSESAASLISAGKAFCYLTDTKPGIESQWERSTGIDITIVDVVPTFSVTNNLNNKWYVPYTSEEPYRAVQILNEMYSNADLANIFIYGIEGVNYQVVDEENGIVDYADGVDASTNDYAMDSWAWPNELIAYKWVSDGADIWNETIRSNEEAVQSPAKGFNFDSSSVENETVACTAILEKYRNGLNTGELDPEVIIPQMHEEMEAAGLSKILEEKQAQLDAWLAAK
jgi:putative aldouronate transport system substrate-binding protein